MQDDLREAKEKARNSSNVKKHKEEEKAIQKNLQPEPEKKQVENSIATEISEPKIETPVPDMSLHSPEKDRIENDNVNVTEIAKSAPERSEKEKLEEIKNDLEEKLIRDESAMEEKISTEETAEKESVMQKKNVLTELSEQSEKTEGDEAGEHKQDKELSDLIKRVSKSMEGPSEVAGQETEKPQEIPKPDKDRELKELIARMSKNLEKEKEVLQEEKGDSKDEIQTTKLEKTEEPKIDPAKSILKNVLQKIENEVEQVEHKEERQPDSYWENLHDTLKNQDEDTPQQEAMKEIEKEIKMEPAEKLPQTESVASIEPEKPARPKEAAIKPVRNAEIEEKSQAEEAGIIVPKEAKNSGIDQTLEPAGNSDYVNPENRLIFGKQEFYSSLRKRIKPKSKEENLENLQNTVKEKEIKLSDEEEKKMLRRQILKKYNINLHALPWVKIIIFTILFLGILGASLYYFIPKFITPIPQPAPISTGESIAKIDQKIPKEVSAKENQVTANYFNSGLDPWKSYQEGDIAKVKISYNDHDILLPRDEALKTILGDQNFQSIPKEVLNLVEQKYDILAFKSNGSLRLGIALQYDQTKEAEFREAMLAWEKTNNKNEKIYNVMKTLFISDRVTETSITTFQPATHNGVELKYVNLPDNYTSMDYFISGDLVIFTTSKDITFKMIDLMKN